MERLSIGSSDLINTAKEPTRFYTTRFGSLLGCPTVLHFVGNCNEAFAAGASCAAAELLKDSSGFKQFEASI
jgi:hypothetical protein